MTFELLHTVPPPRCVCFACKKNHEIFMKNVCELFNRRRNEFGCMCCNTYSTIDITDAYPRWICIADAPFGMILGGMEFVCFCHFHFWDIPYAAAQKQIWMYTDGKWQIGNFIIIFGCLTDSSGYNLMENCQALCATTPHTNRYLAQVPPNLRTTPFRIG